MHSFVHRKPTFRKIKASFVCAQVVFSGGIDILQFLLSLFTYSTQLSL